MFLAHRLAALEEGWNDLQHMWDNKQSLLDQELKEQLFVRDATTCDILLNQQEHLLSKEEVPVRSCNVSQTFRCDKFGWHMNKLHIQLHGK